ncbi:MAG: tetratricopeptide repeat protein [Deltaproteobacteria bacterium]|nr:MAG: tetratricopeptide repeat protein [Deltaproteobacteria bacterium]
MSIIHKALKKAEQDTHQPDTTGVIVDVQDEDSEGSMRKYILMAMVVASLLVVGYFRFYKNKEVPVASLPPVTNQASMIPTTHAPAPQSDVAKELDNSMDPAVSTAGLTEIGIKKMESGDYESAKKMFESVVFREPRNAEAYNNYGLALKKLGKSEEAFEQYRKALSIDPNFAECSNNLGVLYMVNRNLAEAENQFQKAIQMKPDYSDPYLHLGMVLEARGDLNGAKKSYQTFIDKSKGIGADVLVKVQNRMAALKVQ